MNVKEAAVNFKKDAKNIYIPLALTAAFLVTSCIEKNESVPITQATNQTARLEIPANEILEMVDFQSPVMPFKIQVPKDWISEISPKSEINESVIFLNNNGEEKLKVIRNFGSSAEAAKDITLAFLDSDPQTFSQILTTPNVRVDNFKAWQIDWVYTAPGSSSNKEVIRGYFFNVGSDQSWEIYFLADPSIAQQEFAVFERILSTFHIQRGNSVNNTY